MSETRFLSIGHMKARRDWQLKAHRHQCHQMLALVGGCQYARIRGEEITIEAGEAILYPTDVDHAEWTERRRPHESYFVQFEWSGYRPEMPLKVADRKGRIASLMAWLFDERDAVGKASEIARAGFLDSIVGEFVRLQERPAHDMPSRVRAYIRAHLDEGLSLHQLADEAGLSKYHFLRRYKQVTGLSPMEDVRRIRMEVARDLLLTSDQPLKAIAPRVGLANEYHLSRLLKKHLGTGAKALRRYAREA